MYLINQLENALRVSVETLRARSSVLCSDATGGGVSSFYRQDGRSLGLEYPTKLV